MHCTGDSRQAMSYMIKVDSSDSAVHAFSNIDLQIVHFSKVDIHWVGWQDGNDVVVDVTGLHLTNIVLILVPAVASFSIHRFFGLIIDLSRLVPEEYVSPSAIIYLLTTTLDCPLQSLLETTIIVYGSSRDIMRDRMR